MEINLRLKTIADFIDSCEAVADIGTDHAYLPIYLIKKGVCKRAVASDINAGPVKKAMENIRIEALDNKIECRLGGGLTTLKPGEVQCAIIAGMGGNLIRDIIEESLNIYKSLDYLVLQPVQNPEVLRKYLYNNGYEILDENLCLDEGKYYEIIKVKYNENPLFLEDIYYEISPKLLKKGTPLMEEYIKYKLGKYNKIYKTITDTTESALLRREEVKDKIQKLKELLDRCF